MISALFGIPGAGKSMGLAWVARRACQGKPVSICGVPVSTAHKYVYTNFPFKGAYKLDYDSLGKCNYDDCLFLIDEIMMYSDSRDFKNFSKDLKFFFSQHRKMHSDVIWSSQSYGDTDLKIRNLTKNFFLIEPWFFNISTFTHITAFFDIVNFTPVSGYKFGNKQYFRLKPLFPLVDSYATISKDVEDLPPPPLVPWEESGF